MGKKECKKKEENRKSAKTVTVRLKYSCSKCKLKAPGKKHLCKPVKI